MFSDGFPFLFFSFFLRYFKIKATAIIPIHTIEESIATPVLLNESQLPALSLQASQKKEQGEQLYPSGNSPSLQKH